MSVKYLERENKPKLAYIHTKPSEEGQDYPTVMFCGGYRSDMSGTKATYFEAQCQARGQGYIRFDYSGHGESEGDFEDGTIGSWYEDALAIVDAVADGPIVLVGSSMGGWIGLLVALARPDRLHGMIGIAAAPDFTEDIYHFRLNDEQREVLNTKGFVDVPNDYSDEPYRFTKAFYEDGKTHLLLDRTHRVEAPIRLVQGREDKDVPWQTAVKICEVFAEGDIDSIFIDDGGHTLSRPEDLIVIDQQIKKISGIA